MGQILRFPESVEARTARVWRCAHDSLEKIHTIAVAALEAIGRGDLGAGEPAMADIEGVDLPPDLGLVDRACVETFRYECISSVRLALRESCAMRKRLEAERRAADPA